MDLNSIPRPTKSSIQCNIDTALNNENKDSIFKKKVIRGDNFILLILHISSTNTRFYSAWIDYKLAIQTLQIQLGSTLRYT